MEEKSDKKEEVKGEGKKTKAREKFKGLAPWGFFLPFCFRISTLFQDNQMDRFDASICKKLLQSFFLERITKQKSSTHRELIKMIGYAMKHIYKFEKKLGRS